MVTNRLRLFAGPNGSGKTTIVDKIAMNYNLGYIVNADFIEKKLKLEGSYSLKEQDIHATTEMIKDYIREEGFSMQKISDLHYIDSISVTEQMIQLPVAFVNSYVAADIAGFIREKHIENSHTFTFESVLSHPSKLDLLRAAKLKGYRIYLYYIATESADINVNRVKIRVSQQGHPVPETAIRDRYVKSLKLLYDTIKLSDRAYIFDNSGKESLFVAEITNGIDVELQCTPDEVPSWFIKYVINRSIIDQ